MASSPARRAATILQIVPALGTGGAERTAIDIAAALAARGDRALVASAGGRLEGELAAAGGRLVRMNAGAKSPAGLPATAWALVRLIRREGVDLIHARSRAPAWAALAAARIAGTPFVTTFHGIYAEANAAKRFYNSVMARGDVVIANSRFTADTIRARYGTAEVRIVLIPRGTDLAQFSPGAVSAERRERLRRAWELSDERVILNLARLTAWKGQQVLIAAMASPPLAGRSDVVLVLAGDAQGRDGYRAALEADISARGLTGRVRLVGHCDDPAAALALADVAAIASVEPEAFGRTATEAAAMGLPVVAAALGATPETVLAPPLVPEAERTGWLVPPADAGALAAGLAAALALGVEERDALAARARKHAAGFTIEAMQAATLAVYDRLLEQRSATNVKG